MRFLNHKISILFTAILTVALFSCNQDDDVNVVINLEAKFIANIDSRTITFSNISNDAERYEWDFGNGNTSTIVNPVEIFETNGTFDVVLTAFDTNGNSDTFQQSFVFDIPICIDETDENIDPGNGNINWTFLNDTSIFDAFGNTAGFIVDNPLINAGNQSCRVQRFEKTAGCFTFAGLGKALDNPLDFSVITDKVFTMKVLAETQITEVTLRLEFMPFPNTEPSQDRVASITEIGEWQELTFDFSDVPSGTFSSMIIYFERNAECDGDIYYFDDIIQQ